MRNAMLVSALLAAIPAMAAGNPACDAPEFRQFDFWVGDWDLSWTTAGRPQKGRNTVTSILNGCVVAESFRSGPPADFDGISHSTWDREARQWRQTWVDNTGAYLDFTGGWEDGKMVLSRDAEKDGKRIRQRMVFHEIGKDALKWNWESSGDAGRTWKVLWQIDYARRK
jgi:hypothetical protein